MFDLHLGAVREVASWDSVLLLDLGENHRKLVNQIVLLAFFAKNCWHLLLQIADNVGVSLGGDKAQMKPKNYIWVFKYVPKVWVGNVYMRPLTLTKRALFTRSFSLRTAALRGRFLMSAKRSSSSSSISW